MPGKAAISQFVKRWLENPGKREEMVPAKIMPPALITTLKSRQSVVINIPMQHWIRRSLLRCFLSPDAPVLSGNLRDAEKIIADDREDFKRWSASLHVTPNILKYDRASIFGVVQNVPAKDTYHFPESLRRHITSWLEANGRFEEDEGSSQRQPTAEQNTGSNVVKKRKCRRRL